MLSRRRRRRANIDPTLVQYLEFAGKLHLNREITEFAVTIEHMSF